MFPGRARRRRSPTAANGTPARRLGLWLTSLGTSLCADQVFFLALTWVAIQEGTPGQVGLVIAAASLPRLAILVFGGSLADRLNPKLLAAVSDFGRAAAVSIAVALVLLVDLRIWQLVGVAVAVGALDGFFMPAIGAIPALIVPSELMGRAGALRSVVQRVALATAGPISGAMIVWAGTAAGFATAAVLFLLSTASLVLLLGGDWTPARDRAAGDRDEADTAGGLPSGWGYVMGGFTVVRSHAVLPWLLLVVAALNLGFAGPVTAGLPLLAAQQGWGASGAGALMGGFGVGAAVTGLTLVFVDRVPRAGTLLLAGLTTMGLAITAFAETESFLLALADAVLLGLGSGVVSSIVYALLLTTTPVAALGRVMALVSITLEGTFPLSTFVTGVGIGRYGTDLAFAVGGGLLVVTAAAAATRPGVWRLESPITATSPAPDGERSTTSA